MKKLSTADLTCVVTFIYYHGRYYKVFFLFSKKRDLSDTLKTDEDPKKIHEASSASFSDEGDVFNEGIVSLGCRQILFNCLKNSEAKVMEIYEQGNKNKNMLLKAKSNLSA